MKIIHLITLASLCAFFPLTAEDKGVLSVQGQARVSKPADQVRIEIGVVTQAQQAGDALSANNDKMNQLIDQLKNANMEDGEYSSGRFTIYPLYSPAPKDPPPNWQATIVGYQVNNTLVIKTQKLKQIGSWIDTATRAGASNMQGLTFEIKNPRQYRNEVITSATKAALEDAKALAEASGVKLGRIQNIILDEAHVQALPTRKSYGHADYYRSEVSGTPVEPGQVELNGTVDIVFEIN